MPYGYPSSEDLRKRILGNQTQAVVDSLKANDVSNEQLKEFRDSFYLAGRMSIDAFLEHRPTLQRVGKLLIAAHILSCENPNALYPDSDDWYPMLADLLNNRYDLIDFSNTTIVTLNYDRSLEQFLFNAFHNRHGRENADTAMLVRSLNVLHVYGDVGLLEWQVEDGRRYGAALTPESVRRAATRINIISDDRDKSDDTLQPARRAIADADCVFLLGMAYHPENMRRLGFPLPKNKERVVSGTVFDLTHEEIEFRRKAYKLDMVGSALRKCDWFLRDNSYFLSLGK
jgi:hypothetical protein